jgi:two-component system, chemotaxis family, chemotaxis protein CheY
VGAAAIFFLEVTVRPARMEKILVIDDSKLIHKMYEVMLRPHPMVYAINGRDGLQKLAEHPDIDLIILDVNMPQINGLEFLGHAKANPAFAKIPVIIVSTEGKDEDILRGLNAGAAAYIKKPFQREQILQVIEQMRSSQPAA